MCNVCEKPVAKLSTVYENTKPDWCPLIEISVPHGRLIDAENGQTIIEREWE